MEEIYRLNFIGIKILKYMIHSLMHMPKRYNIVESLSNTIF